MIDSLRRLVEAESPSTDLDALAQCAQVIDDLCWDVLGAGVEREGLTLRWRRPGERPVLLLCHYDTVWPPGTILGFPFTVEDGIARGPGVFDMKAGIVQAVWALRGVEGPVTVLFNPDEEIGSLASRTIIEREALDARAVLVLEPAQGRDVKVARKGTGHWRVDIRGRAAHAGLEPEKGINAAIELAHVIGAIEEMADPEAGTSVIVTMAGAGSAENVVPEQAWVVTDARVWTMEEAERLDAAFTALSPTVAGATLTVSGGLNRGPLERHVSRELFERLLALGYDVDGAEVGGASDGNFTAAMGIPTLDGLGPVGGGAHAREEHVVLEEMPPRAAMVQRLLQDLLADG
ncbi:MAG: M20 family metallopeptidase [Actinomycetota bacterium]|nr:M20 family metallopeptidase [Actinomycetota bacterium]